MTTAIIPLQYHGQPVAFNEDGWLNATKIAEWFGKRLDHWMENAETLEYIRALDEVMTGGESAILDTRKSGYVKTSRARADRGGGTWLHPKLAVMFARWLDARFAVWCDMQIDDLLHCVHPARDQLRQACARLEDGRTQASEGARAMARWRWDRPQLEQEVERWCDQLQLLPSSVVRVKKEATHAMPQFAPGRTALDGADGCQD